MKAIFDFLINRKWWVFLLTWMIWGNVTAQNNPPKNQNKISLLAQSKASQIQLRWAPTDPAMWVEGIQNGYTIERQEIKSGKRFDPKRFEKINQNPIKPNSLADFKTIFNKSVDHDYLLVAAECIYGDWKNAKSQSENLQNWVAASDDFYNKFSFNLFVADLDFLTAEASGLAFVDETAEKEKQYIYKIYIKNSKAEKRYVAYQRITNIAKPSAIPKIHSVKNQEGQVVLSWERNWHSQHFSAYHIERSTDGQNFEKITNTPYVHGVSQDSNLYSPNIVFIDEVENYQPYFYRLRGATPFGEWSAPSEVVQGMGIDKTPPSPPKKVEAKWSEGTKIKISWEAENSDDVEKFYVARAFDYKGPYQILTPRMMLYNNARTFIDSEATPFGINYYVVGAVDTAGNVSLSSVTAGFIEDKDAPSPPMGLSGTIDSTGIVNLKWEKGDEPDIKGYYVYFSNSKKDIFTNLTNKPITTIEFIDTISLNSLTKKVFYRVAAIDRRGNYSGFSNFLELSRPDIIPPSTPVFKNYQVLENGISLTWSPSSSVDVAAQMLFRKTKNEDWKLLQTFTNSTKQYIDKDVIARNFYEYKILAKDEAGLISEVASTLRLKAKTKSEQHIYKIETHPNIQTQEIQLTWNTSENLPGNIARFIIYRSVNGSPMTTLHSVQVGDLNFLDTKVQQGKQYTYGIKVVYKDGYKSKMSEQVKVQL